MGEKRTLTSAGRWAGLFRLSQALLLALVLLGLMLFSLEHRGMVLAAPATPDAAETPSTLALSGTGILGHVTKLIAPDGADEDYFGFSVAVDGDTLVVGAYLDDDTGNNSGSVYIFSRDGAGLNDWSLTKKLTAADGAPLDYFGFSVAISGDTIVVGAYGDDDIVDDSGSAYIFSRDVGGLNAWGQTKKLTAADGEMSDQFGWSVAISEGTVVIGALEDDTSGDNSGSAYIFNRDAGGPNAWGQTQKLTAADGTADDYFGEFVAISQDLIAVSAAGDDDNGFDSGSAYIFSRDESDMNAWRQTQKLTAADGSVLNNFGVVAVSGETVVVGAQRADSGAAYIFSRDVGGLESWSQTQKLTAADGVVGDRFGKSVAVSGAVIVAGAYADNDNGNLSTGSAYIFSRNAGGADAWEQMRKLTAADGAEYDYFGHAVAVSGDTAVVAAYLDDDSGFDSGSVYVYKLNVPSKIAVGGGGLVIDNGDSSPSGRDGTDFGRVIVGTAVSRTFSISNSGNGDLILSGTPAVTLSSGAPFRVTAQPAATTLDSGRVTTFTITFVPSAAGQFTDTVHIINNDVAENPYTFVISGTGALRTALTVNLRINIIGNGLVALTPPGTQGSGTLNFSSVYAIGTEVAMNAIPGTHWRFEGWSGDVTASVTATSVVMTSSKVVTATFVDIGKAVYLPLILRMTPSGR